jgi:hypothetical protein
MTRPELLQKLNALFDEMKQSRAWGTIEIEFRDGDTNMIRICKNEKIQSQGYTRGQQPYRQQ